MVNTRSWGPRAALLVLLAPAPAAAQSGEGSLAQLLPRLLSESVTMPSTAPGVAGNPHEAHFLPDVAQLVAPYALNGAVVTQLSTFPIGTSSGGFTYVTDEKTGVPTRSSNNFGPPFPGRAPRDGQGGCPARRCGAGLALGVDVAFPTGVKAELQSRVEARVPQEPLRSPAFGAFSPH